ncbi:hypothetical protein ACERK3_09495 [Phycisphaerales bacterium AB-hyl4]|uniref:Holin n=1 Tax=Natronomicrosphaera hydrolytica TaxID=3242702 RepID=A0ABV4U6S4_9BACT
MSRFTSRKFILALAAQLIALAVLFWPEHENVITEAVTQATALLLSLGTAAGYIHAEGKIDTERAKTNQGG